MNDSASENISAAKAGGLVVLLLAGWLAYQIISEAPKTPVAPSPMPSSPPSSLVRSGLRDYTDWVGLPEIFAVWADKAEWKDGKTRFAYWHPVIKDYSYYFEATRAGGGYRFREIAEPHEADHYWNESLGGDCPIRFYLSSPAFPNVEIAPVYLDPHSGEPLKVKLDLAGPKTPELKANVLLQNP